MSFCIKRNAEDSVFSLWKSEKKISSQTFPKMTALCTLALLMQTNCRKRLIPRQFFSVEKYLTVYTCTPLGEYHEEILAQKPLTWALIVKQRSTQKQAKSNAKSNSLCAKDVGKTLAPSATQGLHRRWKRINRWRHIQKKRWSRRFRGGIF